MKENCKDNKHCWVNMKNAMADHSDCDTCCDCGVAFVNLYHKETIEIPRIQKNTQHTGDTGRLKEPHISIEGVICDIESGWLSMSEAIDEINMHFIEKAKALLPEYVDITEPKLPKQLRKDPRARGKLTVDLTLFLIWLSKNI